MNIIPQLPDPHYDAFRTRNASVGAVEPVPRQRRTDDEQPAPVPRRAVAETDKVPSPEDSYVRLEREYAESREARTARAVNAYTNVATSEKQALLSELLGVDLYA